MASLRLYTTCSRVASWYIYSILAFLYSGFQVLWLPKHKALKAILGQVSRPHGSKRSQPSCRRPQHLPVGLGVACLKLRKAAREFRLDVLNDLIPAFQYQVSKPHRGKGGERIIGLKSIHIRIPVNLLAHPPILAKLGLGAEAGVCVLQNK